MIEKQRKIFVVSYFPTPGKCPAILIRSGRIRSFLERKPRICSKAKDEGNNNQKLSQICTKTHISNLVNFGKMMGLKVTDNQKRIKLNPKSRRSILVNCGKAMRVKSYQKLEGPSPNSHQLIPVSYNSNQNLNRRTKLRRMNANNARVLPTITWKQPIRKNITKNRGNLIYLQIRYDLLENAAQNRAIPFYVSFHRGGEILWTFDHS